MVEGAECSTASTAILLELIAKQLAVCTSLRACYALSGSSLAGRVCCYGRAYARPGSDAAYTAKSNARRHSLSTICTGHMKAQELIDGAQKTNYTISHVKGTTNDTMSHVKGATNYTRSHVKGTVSGTNIHSLQRTTPYPTLKVLLSSQSPVPTCVVYREKLWDVRYGSRAYAKASTEIRRAGTRGR
eukprot:3480297-Rhodomonas_salina.3